MEALITYSAIYPSGSSNSYTGDAPISDADKNSIMPAPPKEETAMKPFVAWGVIVAILVVVRFIYDMAD